ncbi:MAG TPA: hypothetical protein VK369_11310 [Segetibacter sp.]|jgi:hypothetical protein|nr:hypothetical protein [Segetibacter sp.]
MVALAAKTAANERSKSRNTNQQEWWKKMINIWRVSGTHHSGDLLLTLFNLLSCYLILPGSRLLFVFLSMQMDVSILKQKPLIILILFCHLVLPLRASA